MFNISKKSDKIEDFWNWFSLHENEFRNSGDPTQSDEYLSIILEQGRKITEGLALELEPPKNEVIRMTISANGDINLFPIVEKIVEKAPKINGWSFVAFRQRLPESKVKGMILKTDEFVLNPNEIKFKPITNGEDLEMVIFAKDVSEQNRNQIAFGCLMLIDNILGEYDAVKKIKGYDIQNLSSNNKDLKSLTEIAKYVDDFYKN